MNLKKYQDEDCERVVELLNLCFAGKKITSQSFLWKHFDAYFQNGSLAFLAEEKNKAVSFVCLIPNLIYHQNHKLQFYSCAVQATHPDFRRRGLVSKLTTQVEELLGASANYYGFSNDSGVNIDRYSKNIPYQIIGQLVTAYLPAHPFSRLKTQKVLHIPKSFLDDSASSFLEMHKDTAYLDWRYLRNPKTTYIYLEVSEAQQIIGYVIAKKCKLKYEVSEIIAPKKNAVFQKILNAFSRFTFQNGKGFYSITYLPNLFWKKSVPPFSVKRKISIYFTLKSFHVSGNANDWILQGGDIL